MIPVTKSPDDDGIAALSAATFDRARIARADKAETHPALLAYWHGRGPVQYSTEAIEQFNRIE